MSAIAVLIVCPLRLYRDALVTLLHGAQEFEVIAALSAASEWTASPNGADPDAVLMDARLFRNKSEVAQLRGLFPGALIVGVTGTDRDVVRCTRAGVDGILGPDAGGAELVDVIGQIRRGEFPGTDPIATALFRHLANGRRKSPSMRARLTPRERKVASLAARGFSNKRIAQVLHLELATVKNHMHRILAKLGLKRRSELAARFRAVWHES